jgi:hypothetical protein
MPDFVRCPRCGCGVGVADALVGRPVRCIACDHHFVPDTKAAERTEVPSPPRPPLPLPKKPVPAAPGQDARVLCPGCGAPVGWLQRRCPYCKEEFLDEPLAGRDDGPLGPRRDTEPHQGNLIANLGKASALAGLLTFFTCGLGSLIGLPLGLVTWALARNQLSRIDAGLVDASGRTQTEFGRQQAILGIFLSTVFGMGYVLAWWSLH